MAPRVGEYTGWDLVRGLEAVITQGLGLMLKLAIICVPFLLS